MNDLTEVKKKIKFVSPDEEINKILYDRTQLPGDCFGIGYEEGNKYCADCVTLAESDGRREQISTFCKELTDVPEERARSQPEIKKGKKEELPAWKLELKEMFDRGCSKDEIINKISSGHPEIKKGLISLVHNGFLINKQRRGGGAE